MTTPDNAHPYQLWLAMKHIDDPSSLNCKACHLSYDEFTATKKSCKDAREDLEIERKKLSDNYSSPSQGSWRG